MENFDFSPLWISLKTAIAATAIASVGGIVAARYMYEYQGRWRGLADGILTLPLVLPPTVVGFVLLWLLGRHSPLGQLLKFLGVNLIFSWPAAVVASTVVAFPLAYKTVLGAFRQVDPNLLHCARTLGAREGRVFWQVLLPLAWPGVVAGTILAFARALGEFGATLMVAGSIPGRTETMPIAIFFAGEAGRNDEAFLWVAILGSLALSAIALMNYLGEPSVARPQPRAEALAARLQRWAVILGRKFLGLDSDRSPLPAPPSEILGLEVAIEKALPQFTLALEFATQPSVRHPESSQNPKSNNHSLGILGPSGAGKSTLLRCIAGMATPDRGRIVLNDRVLFDAERGIDLPSAQRRVGFMFQNYALFPHMRVARNIGFGLQHLSQTDRIDRVGYWLNLLQLQDFAKLYPHQLSGGQQQRVALARALAVEPEVLLLDEPLSALDNFLRSQVEKQLADLFANYRGSVLLVTHKLEEAYRLCNRLLVIDRGEAIACDRKDAIFERPATYAVARITECKNISSAIAVDDRHARALDWGCVLRVAEPLPETLAYIGIRAHHLRFSAQPGDENTFACRPAIVSESQHRVTLYLELLLQPDRPSSQQLQAEIPKERWLEIKNYALPWFVTLAPLRLMLMSA